MLLSFGRFSDAYSLRLEHYYAVHGLLRVWVRFAAVITQKIQGRIAVGAFKHHALAAILPQELQHYPQEKLWLLFSIFPSLQNMYFLCP